VQEAATRDLAAYELFLRAQASDRGVTREAAEVAEQVKLLEEAVARDPQFVAAWGLLVRVHLRAYFFNIDHSEARLASARKALAAAVAIAPHAGEVKLAEATLLYWGERKYEMALEKLAEARRSLPNDSNVPLFTGLVKRRQGKWEEAIQHIREAASLDPRNANTLFELANTLRAPRRYKEEVEVLDGLLSWNPGDYFVEHARGMADLNRSADPRRLQKVLAAEWPSARNQEHVVATRLWLALLLRDHAAADKILAAYPKPEFRAAGYVVPRELYEGIIARGLGNDERARAAFSKAREAAARIAEAQPKDGKALMVLAMIDARLGQDDAARRQAEHAVRLLPVSKDAPAGVEVLVDLAEIYARIGEKGRALDILEEAAKLPLGLHYGFLKLDETWDPLRAEPRFEKLLSAFAPE
jgi:tetratricopeptide (TPR) repeat protein